MDAMTINRLVSGHFDQFLSSIAIGIANDLVHLSSQRHVRIVARESIKKFLESYKRVYEELVVNGERNGYEGAGMSSLLRTVDEVEQVLSVAFQKK
jgi:hypothetical protein